MTGVVCIAKRPIPAYTKTLVNTVQVIEPRLNDRSEEEDEKRTICIVMPHSRVRRPTIASRLASLTGVFVRLFPESFDVLTESILRPVLPLLHIRKGRPAPSGAGAHVLVVHLHLQLARKVNNRWDRV